MSSHDGNKHSGQCLKKMDFRPRNCIFGPKNLHFFTLHPYNPHWVRWILPNVIISPPYPEATLDNFSFPAGGRLAARRAVSQPRLPKVALFGHKVLFSTQHHVFVQNDPYLARMKSLWLPKVIFHHLDKGYQQKKSIFVTPHPLPGTDFLPDFQFLSMMTFSLFLLTFCSISTIVGLLRSHKWL